MRYNMVKIIEVIPGAPYTLNIKLDNGKTGTFDLSPFIDKGIFQELKDEVYFRQVKNCGRSISWPHEQDFCADTIDELLKS
ncbi:MAG: DUF2442 domain-containing protein [Chitinivibrionales bacterium]|nr:DUF2442 domain-containing protein [Chitinivibrionales bacterium]MBD3357735.1 DUF2442 domain-containing protein [Chitinivibrionales bacterium]